MILTNAVDGIANEVILIDAGIVICVNDEHLLKASSPISVTDDGIVICVSD